MANVVPSSIPNAASDPEIAAFDAAFAVTPAAGSGAVTATQGDVPITATSVAVLTLAQAPTGLPSVGGGDGHTLRFIDTTGHAHTITTPANGIVGGKHVATFGGVVGSFIELKAYQGVWYPLASSGVTLS